MERNKLRAKIEKYERERGRRKEDALHFMEMSGPVYKLRVLRNTVYVDALRVVPINTPLQ